MARGGALVLMLLGSTLAFAAPKERVFRRRVRACDGASLALSRYVPVGGGGGRAPVLVIPDLGMGREAFDLRSRGLAPFFQSEGREVFVAELRGQTRWPAPPRWRLKELVACDLPPVARAIAAVRPGPIDLVVHGFSGALVLAAVPKELEGKVRRVVAISPAVAPEVPNRFVESLLRSGGRLSTFGTDPEGARVFELLFARGGAFGAGVLSELRDTGMRDLGRAAAADLLAWMKTGDLTLADGTTVQGRIARYDRPTLLLLPLRDNFSHPEFASPLRERSRALVSVRVLSRLEYLTEDYSHVSVLHGVGAIAEVFRPALRFLDEEPENGRGGEVPSNRSGGPSR